MASARPRAYADASLWLAHCGESLAPREPAPGDRDFDVVIAGGGYTGLWTAYYLKTLAPHLSVCVAEAHVCGFGASGRNGGWLMGAMEGEASLLQDVDGERRRAARTAITGIVGEVARVLERESIECDFVHGGGLYAAARYPEQLERQRQTLAALRRLGYGDEDYRWLEPESLSQRLQIRRPQGAVFTPHIARIQPAKLVRQLARRLEAQGVVIYEQTPVTAVAGDALVTPNGHLRSPVRVLALEGFSYGLTAQRRRVLPVASMVVASDPLSASQWGQIGLAQREVFSDASPAITYGQRTADDRMVFGSRGGYRFGGRPRSSFSRDEAGFEAIRKLARDCFPQLDNEPFPHTWGGTLGVPRRFHPHAVFDPRSGLATAGGYLGEGVGASNLMARTLADLILERDTILADLPWAYREHPDNALPRWEPEPLRWLGYSAVSLGMSQSESVCRQGAPRWRRGLVKPLAWLSERIIG